MTKTDDFFIPENVVRLRQELDYGRVGEYVNPEEVCRLGYRFYPDHVPHGPRTLL